MAGVHHQKLKALSKSCVMLIVIAGEERFAFKGVAANLVTYLTDVVKMSNSAAAKTVNSWCGLTSIMPLMVAPLADSYWSRYSTILSFSFIYLVGLAALTSTAYTWTASTAEKPSASFSFLFFSLCLTSLGQGGFNPSLQAFGADQLDNDDETIPSSTKDSSDNKSNKKSSFFKWWYFGVCTGSLLGVTVMSYIQDTFGWVLGFAIPMMAMLTAMIFFVCGSQVYMYKSDDGKEAIHRKPFINIVRSVKAAASKFRNSSKTSLPNEKSEEMELELQERPLCPNKEAAKELDENIQNGSYLVQNAKIVLRLIPMWTMLLMFAVIFQQPATFFTKQGMTMKRNIGSHFKIPPATLQSAITVSIILLMPLYDTLFIPFVQKITRNEKSISVLQRMGIGMFLSVIAMIIAAVVETKRIELSIETNTIERSKGGNLQTVPLSIFWLLPQYVLLGISDIFTVVGMQEFFYNEVPMRMRTMAFALYTSVFGVGSFLSALMITCIEVVTTSGGGYSWFSDDMSKARLDKYYWLLALATALSLVLYIILCKFYKSRSELENGNCK